MMKILESSDSYDSNPSLVRISASVNTPSRYGEIDQRSTTAARFRVIRAGRKRKRCRVYVGNGTYEKATVFSAPSEPDLLFYDNPQRTYITTLQQGEYLEPVEPTYADLAGAFSFWSRADAELVYGVC